MGKTIVKIHRILRGEDMITFRAAVASCPGKNNNHNGDNFYFNSKIVTEELSNSQILLSQKKEQSGVQFYAVSDGSAADRYEEEASLQVVKTLKSFHARMLEDEEYGVRNCLRDFPDAAGEAVRAQLETVPGSRMYATVALLCIDGKDVYVCNVGDTKIYRYRGGRLRQLSEDHTQAQRMVKLELLTPEKAKTHPKRHKLTQYFGAMPVESSLEPFYGHIEAKNDDIFLLCSSGFFESVSEARVLELLHDHSDPAELVDLLMTEAAGAGLAEDATIMVVKASDSEAAALPQTGAAVGVGMAAVGTAAKGGKKQPLFVHSEDEYAASKPSSTTGRPKKSGVFLKIAEFFGYVPSEEDGPEDEGDGEEARAAKSPEQIWPVLIIFGICLVFLIILAWFGVKLYRNSGGDPTATPPSVTATPGPESASPGGTAGATSTPDSNTPSTTPTKSPSTPTKNPNTPTPNTPTPGTPEPNTPDPNTPEPGTPEPGTPDPNTPEPGTPEPGTPDPNTPEPGTPETTPGETETPAEAM